MDLKSLPKRWNDFSLRDIATLPEYPSARPWPMLGMLVIGLVAGAAIGGYAVSQRAQMKRLAKHARRMGDQLAAMSNAGEPASKTKASHSNHGRKATAEVSDT